MAMKRKEQSHDSMKQHEVLQELIVLLQNTLNGTSISVSDKQATLLVSHLNLLMTKNTELNLTAITDVESALVLHVIDSLLLYPYIEGGSGRLLDIGSGGGYPGIPLAIMTERPTTLLDSLTKKTQALESFINELELRESIEVVCARVEEFAHERPSHYEYVCARAVAPLPVLVEYATPLLCMGGRLVAAKGTPDECEIESGDKAAEICGLERLGLYSYALPQKHGNRTVIVYQKQGDSKIKLPRRIGKAKKNPLG